MYLELARELAAKFANVAFFRGVTEQFDSTDL